MAKSNSNRGHKLMYYLDRLSRKEKKQFQQYLESPLLGNSLQGVRILKVLDEKMQSEDMGHVLPDWFQADMIPDEPMDEKKIHYIWVRLSVFQEKLQEFIAFQEYRIDRTASNHYFLQAAKNRGWEKFLLSGYRKSIARIPKSQGAKSLRSQLDLELIVNEYLSDHAGPDTDTHLVGVMDSLDSYFVLQKLKYACAAENARLMWGQLMEPKLLEPALNFAKNLENGQSPVISAYSHALKMLKISDGDFFHSETHYLNLAASLGMEGQFSRTEAVDLFTYAQNYCVIQIHQKRKSFFSELKRLYEGVLKTGIILQSGLLSSTFYKNTVIIMCRIGEFDWVSQFIGEYKDKLSDDPGQLAYRYNLAVLEFHQGKHAQVISGLYHHIHLFEHISYGIGARIYLCKALWEQQEYEWLNNVLVAFRQYLYRNQELLAADKTRYTGFAKRLLKIVKIITGNPGKIATNLTKLRLEMDNTGDLALYPWLRQIIENRLD